MSVDAEQPEYLTVKETAQRLGVHENTIRNWVRQGILATARIPGSRFHRFDARDVERLRKQRGEAVSSVEHEHRTIGPELVDGTQLSQWAGTKDAQHRFPELVRRLLASTPGVTNVSVRSGEGVSAPGWDGRAESTGTSFLPAGSLAFELGVDAGSKAKADKDFRKRRDNPQGVVPGETVFIFATPRRWTGAAAWATARRAEGVFRDVQVLDADDLEGWLHATPAVHHWISQHLGRRPQDAETLDRWWARFQMQTDPPLPPALFLAGRDGEREKLVEFFGNPPSVITIQASWFEDAIAFVCATIDAMEDGGSGPVQPPLLVKSAEVWDRVVTQVGRMTLLPLFEAPDLASALAGGHHVVIPVGREQVVGGATLELPRPHRQAAGEALEAAGIDADRSYRLAALARRNMPSFVRELSRDPRRARPPWSELPHAAILAPLILVGAWTPSDDDTDLVSRMVDKPWAEIERTLLHWRTTEDPPFVMAGSQWHVAAAEEAFRILRDAITASDLGRWRQLAVEVLLETDPRLELAPEDRPMAGMRGVARKHSEVLRRGIAEGVALVGSADDYRLSDGISGLDHARRVVREILDRANTDETGQIWRSLADVLPLLAEAAPDVFLEHVHDDLEQNKLLATMFQDGDQSSWLYSSSPHTGLLWALETLCWSPDYLLEASRALARLQVVDPGGRLSNRPLESLGSVLVGWIRHTAAPLDLKVRAIGRICESDPTVGWKLLAALWPSQRLAISPPSAPRYHDWKPESRNVSIAEWVEYIGHLVRLAIGLVDADPGRWSELVEHISPLPPVERDRLLDALDAFADPEALDPASRLLLWDQLHKTVAHHRRFPSADWSMDDGPLSRLQAIADRLEPATNVERFAYLFDWRPDLPDVEVYDPNVEIDHAAYDQKLLELRTDAVTQTLEDASLDGLRKLAERAAAPHHLGWVVGAVADEGLTPDLLMWVDATDPKLRSVGAAWAGHKLQEHGIPWLRDALARSELTSTAHRIAVALCAPATSELWDVLAEIDGDLSQAYWERMATWNVPPEDIERAVRELLSHNRPWIAVDLLAMAMHRQDEGPTSMTPTLVEDVLAAAMRTRPDNGSQSIGYEVGQLLDYLAAKGTEPVTVARYEFAFFRLLEHHRHPRALFAALADDPSLFVELMSLVYKAKNAPSPPIDKDATERATHAWWILSTWRQLPGQREDGTIDAEHLNRWVRDARLALADNDRAEIGDEQIGQVLSASPDGSDGIWPAEAVREIIETLGNQNIATGMHVGVVNARGVTSRGVYDGGQQERAIAARYRAGARQTIDRWPRTSRILRGISEDYERDAQRADARAEISGDTE